MPDLHEILRVSTGKVAYVIACSRDHGIPLDDDEWDDADDPEFDPDMQPDLADDAADHIADHMAAEPEDAPEPPQDDLERCELRGFLDSLSPEERVSLIALAWIGRGTYAAGELPEALSAAKAVDAANASAYLFNLPLLPDYLEDALEQLGVSVM
jgi:hypothetical protein